MSAVDHIIYGLLWLSFGLGHSLLASLAVKAALSGTLGRFYRITYNLISSVHLLLVWLVGHFMLGHNAIPFDLGAVSILQHIATFTGVVVGIIALSHYDLGRFAGTTQIRLGETETVPNASPEPLHMTGLHRYVRHPLYLGLFLILFGRATNEFNLATAIWASLYLMIGTWFEERKLITLYGDAYRSYRKQVPMFLPWRGRAVK